MMINEITTQELLDMQANNESPRLIDVRTLAEVSQGALPEAEHMVMHTIPLKLSELKCDKPIVFYCRTGARSAQVCHFLQQQGLENAINLRGGIMGWVRHGQPVASGEAILAKAS